jgi:hypothetical protein
MAIFYTWNILCLLNANFLSYKLKSELYTDMINEFFIIIILYHLLVFNDFNSPLRSKNMVGFSMIVVMLLNMVLNFTLIMISNLRQIYRVLRTKYYTWKRDRLLQKIQDNDEFSEIEE